MAGIQKRTFSFYRFFCPQTCSQKMEIPISYMKSVRRVLPSKVLVRNRFKKIWSMEIKETRDRLFFQNGWAKFVEDNTIINGDCLVFDYDGYGVFDFVLLDQSECEKIVVADAQTQVTKWLKENYGDDNSEDMEVVLVDLDSNSVIEEVKKDEEMDEAEEGADNVEEVEPYMLAFTRSKGKRYNACGPRRVAGAREGSSSEKTKDVPDHFGADLFRSGRYAQPRNPYFVTKLRAKRRDDLYIPMDVIKDHNIAFPPTLILRDPRGKEWKAKAKIWSDGRTWLSGGWRSLCRWNLVEKEDRCICEFVPPRGKDMVLQVTIVRGEVAKNRKETGPLVIAD